MPSGDRHDKPLWPVCFYTPLPELISPKKKVIMTADSFYFTGSGHWFSLVQPGKSLKTDKNILYFKYFIILFLSFCIYLVYLSEIYIFLHIMNDFSNNKKYKSILDKSQELFWKYGFRRVTIEEICREAKVSKMTFYKFFTDKLDLARSVFDRVSDEALVSFRNILHEESTPPEKMKKILQLKQEGTNNISREFLNDFYNNPGLGLTPYIEERSNAMWKEVLELFKKGQEEGWIRKDMKVEFMFLFMQKTMQLTTDRDLQDLYNSQQDLIMELTNMFFYGITPAN